MNTTAIEILEEIIEKEVCDGYQKAILTVALERIKALQKPDDELIDFALWYHRDLTDSQRESNIWDLISFFRSLPPTKLPQ